jgi:signal transduction histidine kinase
MTQAGVKRTPDRQGAPTPEGARLHAALAYLPYVLVAVAFGAVLATGGPVTGPEHLPWMVALTVLALGYRIWWQAGTASHRWRVAGFVLNVLLTLALISLSPLYGIYAFVGYLDAVVLFSGPAEATALVATASLNALAQSGGPGQVLQQPLIFVLLLVVNGALAVAMVRIDRNRQRTVTRLTRTLEQLEDAERANRALQDQVVAQARTAGVLEERQRLSREIHDTVAQQLVALLRQIEAASEAATLAETRGHLARADETARDGLAEARRAVGALASPRLDSANLADALQTLTSGWSEASGIAASCRATGTPSATAADADLLRICQEALANTAHHSAATEAAVDIAYAEDEIRLTIRDNGIGFDDRAVNGGHGVPGMRDRARAAGGTLSVESSEGGGCTVRAAIPR